ncbi:hypothetical protein QF037_006628 [Streptomyces canus]|nr:hypothetical protein [Streptomyces canus]
MEPESLTAVQIIHGARGVEVPNGFLTVVFVAQWTGEPGTASLESMLRSGGRRRCT